MTARLMERGSNPQEKREIAITKPEFVIGRGSDCDLRLSDTAISRHHCLLRLGVQEATIHDLGSSNGTFVNGQRIRSQVTLHSGDQLQVGKFAFVLDLGGREGISWGDHAASDPAEATCKLTRKERLALEADEKKGDHPPGAAGGQGELTGTESR